MAGATAVFAKNPFERRFRDMHAIAQQIQARDTHYEDAGKAILAARHHYCLSLSSIPCCRLPARLVKGGAACRASSIHCE
jgi:hypothetical protein